MTNFAVEKGIVGRKASWRRNNRGNSASSGRIVRAPLAVAVLVLSCVAVRGCGVGVTSPMEQLSCFVLFSFFFLVSFSNSFCPAVEVVVSSLLRIAPF